MQALIIEKTKTTPGVTLDSSKGIFKIEGKSLPENAIEFYQPVMKWLQEYLLSPNPETVLTFEMQYFNTASSKLIYEIICLLKEPKKNGFDVKVNWCYSEDDDDTLESGKDYSSLVTIPFTFTEIIS